MFHFLFASHLDDNEKILYVAHRHLFILYKDSVKTQFFGIALPIVLFLFFPQALYVALFWFAVGVCVMIYHFVDWYFDAWLLTNTGVIDIERNGIFDRSSTRVEYHMVEGVGFTIKGFWATILNFGEITLDKLGAKTSVVLLDGASPKKIERLILRYQDRYVSDRSVRDHHALKDMLSEMIAYHIQSKKIEKPKID